MAEVICPVLVGRDRERDVLEAAVAAARAGRGGVVAVRGEAGVGKSRLAAELAATAARQGLLVLCGRAVQAEQPTTFRPLAEALLAGVRTEGLPADPELEPFLPALGRLVPAWRGDRDVAVEDSPVVVGEAVLRLLRTLAANRGCLLVLEDLHWADPETLSVVEFLADNLGAESVCCLVTLRADERSPAQLLTAALHARRVARLVDLCRLADDEVAAMTRACLSAAQVPEEVEAFARSHADGLPFFVEELLGGLVDSGALVRRDSGWVAISRLVPSVPLTFVDTVRRRLGAGEHVREVLQAAAMLGRRFDWTLLPPLTGHDESIVLAVLRHACEVHLLAADPDGFRFRHALTRDAVLGELTPPEQARLALRAATAVEDAHPDLEGELCDLVAELRERAGDPARAAAGWHTSAQRALARGALATAEATLQRARRLSYRDPPAMVALDETLMEALALAGKIEEVFAVGAALLGTLAAIHADPAHRAQAHLRLARAAVAGARWMVAAQQLDQARQATTDEGIRARVDALAAHVALGQGDEPEATACARWALAAAERARLPEVACEALEVIGRAVRERDLDEAEAAFDRALAVAEAHGLTVWRIRALHELGTIDLLGCTGRLDRLLAAREAASQAGALATLAVIDLHTASVLWGRMASNEALEAIYRCVELSRRLSLATLPIAIATQAGIHALAGHREDMEAAITEALAVAPEDVEIHARVWGEARGVLWLREGDPRQATEALDRAMTFVRQSPTMPFRFRGLWALLRTVYDDGSAAREEVRACGHLGNRLIRPCLQYADAVALGQAGHRAQAEARFGEADATYRRHQAEQWCLHHIHRVVAEAALRDGWGDPVAWLREALAWLDAHGQDRAASSCRSLLRQAGAAVPRKGRGDAGVPAALRVMGVTSREMDVLLLVAEGLSNPEIGARLFLSPRTVEKHVASLLARTGARGRAQLAALAARLADPG